MSQSFANIKWVDVTSNHIHMIREELDKKGIVFIRNVTTEDQFISIGEKLGSIYKPRHGTADGITKIEPTHEKIGNGYTRQELYLHIDRSQEISPPKYLMTTCSVKATLGGGHSTFLDGNELYDKLSREEPEILEQLKNSNNTQFLQDDGSYQSLAIFGESNAIRFRLDDKILISGTLAKNFNRLLEIMNQLTHTVEFELGEGYIIDNRWWLHGRTGFKGDRAILRLLVTSDSGPIKIVNRKG
jgi:alpha-ketoglutarate-dependent taurine dioxygenase